MSEVREAANKLLESLKGIERARVEVDARGRITHVELIPAGVDDRAAMRNAQSALMAVFGQSVDVNAMSIASAVPAPKPQVQPQPVVKDSNVIEIRPRAELNDAARVAFDTLRAAQSSFHGFQFDGAELVRIGGQQYVVVAVRKASNDAKYCGAAPVIDTVNAASARALMNAVGVAAMGASHIEITNRELGVAIS